MKSRFKTLSVVILLALGFPQIGAAQENQSFEIGCEINQVYEPLSISRKTMDEAETISDLNVHYKNSWVKEYKSVEIITINDGNSRKVTGLNHTLTQDQQENMRTADIGSPISVIVRYIPDNTLSHNDIQEFDFTFKVNPERPATFAGGKDQLIKYINDNAVDKISTKELEIYNVTAVKFTIDEDGHVANPEVVAKSKDKELDNLLIKTICNMPTWQPASYADGTRVKQEFMLTIGDHSSCTMNVLNVRRN